MTLINVLLLLTIYRVNKIFVTGGSQASLIDCNSNLEVNTYSLNNTIGLTYDQNSLVFCSGHESGSEYDLRAFNIIDGSLVYYEHNNYGIGYRLDYNTNSEEVLSANFRECYMAVFNNTCIEEKIWHTGGRYYDGCSNEDGSVLYFIQKFFSGGADIGHDNFNAHIIAYNIESDEFTSIELGSKLSDIDFNRENNKIVVSSIGNNSIFIIDANDYLDIIEVSEVTKPYSIESSDGDFVYIGGFEEIYFLDISNQTLFSPLSITGGDIISDLVVDNDLNSLYVGGGYNITTVDVENINNPLIVNTTNIYGTKTNMHLIKEDEDIYKLAMIAGSSNFVILDLLNYQYITHSNILNTCYSPLERKIYGEKSETEVFVFDLEGTQISQITTPILVLADITYNNINNSVYVAGSSDDSKTLTISSIDCSSEEITTTVSFNENGASENVMAETSNNRIVNVNGYLSNISTFKALTDNLPLKTGWNWLSFPRMQRYSNEPVQTSTVLSRIDIFPVNLSIEFKDEYNEFFTYVYDPDFVPPWQGQLSELQSTLGYKLNIELFEGPTPNIDLHGAVLDPATEITIFPGSNIENWKGYFIDYPQEVEDCIPAAVMNDLYVIKTQRWTMFKLGTNTWFTHGRKTPLKYGDMVIFKTNSEHTFSWISSEEIKEESSIPQTEYFTYEEQSDYLPVYVEFDQTSDVQEIAIKANGEVKGAAVREQGDTIVQVSAYLEGVPSNTPLEFETYNGYKSESITKGD